MKLKILHVLHSLRIGGLENGVINLVNNMDPCRFDHAICCIDASGPMEERLSHPIEMRSLGKGNGKDYLLPFRLTKVIREIGPDIVHTRNWGSIDGVIAARLAGVRYIIHGEHGREAADPTGANRRRRLARKVLHPLIYQFVAVSEDIKKWLVEDVGIPLNKVVKIINGVDTERFQPAGYKTAAKTKLGLEPDAFVIGSVGRLDPVKDYATLVRAFAIFASGKTGLLGTTDKTLLVIAGTGPEEGALRRLAGELGIMEKIHFLGERLNISQVMQAMDVFVLPSIAEGISNTILEAMACGLPVVATEAGGNGELVEDGETGFLFPPKEKWLLGEKLTYYIRHPEIAREHGIRGRKRIEARFSLARMVQEYESLYLDMVQGRIH